MKDAQLYYSDLKNEPVQLTYSLLSEMETLLGEIDVVIDEEIMYDIAERLRYHINVSDNGELVFYPDKLLDNGENCFDLYFKNVKDPQADAVLIDSGVRSYVVDKTSAVVFYAKGNEEGVTVYKYNIEDGSVVEICTDVYSYYLSDDGKTLISWVWTIVFMSAVPKMKK